ncbi:hypothetical protein NKH18_06785 [Streptomyces sp. M10(2022)]
MRLAARSGGRHLVRSPEYLKIAQDWLADVHQAELDVRPLHFLLGTPVGLRGRQQLREDLVFYELGLDIGLGCQRRRLL